MVRQLSKRQKTLNLSVAKSELPITKLDIYNRFKFIQTKNKLHIHDKLSLAFPQSDKGKVVNR